MTSTDPIRFSSLKYGRTKERRQKSDIPTALITNILPKKLPESEMKFVDQCIKCGAYINPACHIDETTKLWKCVFCENQSPNPVQSSIDGVIPSDFYLRLEHREPYKSLFIIDATSTSRSMNFIDLLVRCFERVMPKESRNVAFGLLTSGLTILGPNETLVSIPDLDDAIIPPNCFFNYLPSLDPLLKVSLDREGPDVLKALQVGSNSVGDNGKIFIAFTFQPKGDIAFKFANIEAENAILKGINYTNPKIIEIQKILTQKHIQVDFLISQKMAKTVDAATFSRLCASLGGRIDYITPWQFKDIDSVMKQFLCSKIVGTIKSSKDIEIQPSLGIVKHSPAGFSVPDGSCFVFPFKFVTDYVRDVVVQLVAMEYQNDGSVLQHVYTRGAYLSDDLDEIFKNSDVYTLIKFISSSMLDQFYISSNTLATLTDHSLSLLKPIYYTYRYYVSQSPTKLQNLVSPTVLEHLPLLALGILRSTPFSQGTLYDERAVELFKIHEMSPEMLLKVAKPSLYNITEHVKNNDEIVNIEFIEKNMDGPVILLLDTGFSTWLWVGNGFSNEFCKKTFDAATNNLIEELKELESEENKRIFRLIKGNFRLFVHNKTDIIFRSRIIEEPANKLPSYNQFVSKLHRLTLDKY